MQSLPWLKYIFFHFGTSKLLGHSWQRDTGSVCQPGKKGRYTVLLGGGGLPISKERTERDGLCIRAGFDLSAVGDCKGLLFVIGFSYLCPTSHASEAVLISLI